MRRTAILLLLTMGLCGVIRAEIPLVLEATIQLPSNGGWDVQHWMSDFTLGWACISGDTILYVPQLGDSVQRFLLLNGTDCGGLQGPFMYQVENVQVLRLDRAPNHAFVIAQSAWHCWHYDDESFHYQLFSLLDLSNGNVVDSVQLNAGGYYENGGHGLIWTYTITGLLAWPLPPDTTQRLFVTRRFEHQGTETGDIDFDIFHGEVTSIDLEAGSMTAAVVSDADRISPFVRSEPLRFALNGSHSETWHRVGYPDYHFDSCWVNTFMAGGNAGLPDYGLGCISSVAQQDSDGTERILISGAAALNPDNYTVLWRDSSISGTVYSALLAGSGDERLLTFHSATQCFSVYNAATGAYLDETSPIIGDVDHIIKRADRLSEIVTHDAGNVVRVYRAGQASPDGLTCICIPDSNLLRLSWSEVPGAVEYHVYSGPTPGSAEALEAVVPAPAHSLDLTPQDGRRFYFVTAGYAAR